MEGARADDFLFVHCEWTEHGICWPDVDIAVVSGHGIRKKDVVGDELDGLDECGAV